MAFKIGSSKKANPATTLLVLLFLSLVLSAAFAASGGRMGGDSFSNPKKASSSSSSSSSSSFASSSSYPHHHHHHHPAAGVVILVLFIIFFCIIVAFICCGCAAAEENLRSSVVMVQVGLTGKASSLLKELNEIAKTTDTSSSKGWTHILTETTTALLRHRQHFISGYSSVNKHRSDESLEKNFRQLSMEEREKIETETLVNVNNFRRQKAVVPIANKLGRDYIVVTILIAARGFHKIPAIKSIDALKEILLSLNFASERLEAVEVIWTPQDESDTLSEEEFLEDYPLLRPMQ